MQPAAPDRSPPHSAEAEEHVIACCLLDDGDTLERARAILSAESFYFPANRLIFEVMESMLVMGVQVGIETLTAELDSRRQLAAVGGLPYLMQVTGKIPTTAHAGYFIDKVQQKHQLRELIKAATGAIEQAYANGGDSVDELLERTRTSVTAVAEGRSSIAARGFMSFKVPPDDDPMTLLGNRYLVRGDGALMVSTSGMGKSSFTFQAASHWGIGRPFLGIQCHYPKAAGGLRSLIIGAEDSDGDIGEVAAGVKAGMKLTAEEEALIDKNVLVIDERIARGAAFLAKLRTMIRKFKPDLVWINPLMAFADGEITKAEVMGSFLREGLNQINAKKQFAYVIIHHTPKPPQSSEKSSGDRKWNEVMYEGAGSADLTNWARAIMVLKASEVEGEFDLFLAKRGKRAGAVTEMPQGAGARVEPTTQIPLKHATGTIQIEGRKRPLPMIYWETRSVLPPKPEDDEEEGDSGEVSRPAIKNSLEVLQFFPGVNEEPEGFPSILRLCKESMYTTPQKFENIRQELMARGLIRLTEDRRYQRTEAGEMILDTPLL